MGVRRVYSGATKLILWQGQTIESVVFWVAFGPRKPVESSGVDPGGLL